MSKKRRITAVSILRTACDELLKDSEFWILAGLTDRSIETGGSKYFRPAVQKFALGGISQSLIDRVSLGVNANLCRILEEKNQHCGDFRANRGEKRFRPDVGFERRDTGGTVRIEVKVIFGLTSPAFFGTKGGHGVEDDATKLKSMRVKPDDEVLQLVFFLQLPNYDYPSGCSWEKKWMWNRARTDFRGLRTIAQQYALVTQRLRKPMHDLKISPLPLPPRSMLKKIELWCRKAFRPDVKSWVFHAREQLQGVAVGYAIWDYSDARRKNP